MRNTDQAPTSIVGYSTYLPIIMTRVPDPLADAAPGTMTLGTRVAADATTQERRPPWRAR
jgi:hypothetical protein